MIFFPDFQFALNAFNLETPVWYHKDQYFRCHFHCLQKLLLPFTFPSKKISASSNKHHIFIIYVYTQDLKVSDNFACPKSLFPIWTKYFGSFAKIAPYLTSYSTKVQIDIYLILWQLFYKIRKQSNITERSKF